MPYASYEFLAFVAGYVLLYYVFPMRFRWVVSLVASGWFYWMAAGESPEIVATFVAMIVLSYVAGLLIDGASGIWRKVGLCLSTILLMFILVMTKMAPFFPDSGFADWTHSLIVPVGLSFFSLQMVGYLADIYRGKTTPQKNFLKYALFSSYFPQIIQGPIPRYSQVEESLLGGNAFDDKNIRQGAQLILWGFFLKYMIADKAAVMVDTVFGSPEIYTGWYVTIAAFLYSLQLYTDFMACTTISRGVARLVGIDLPENFNHPYISSSIGEFWRRWHMSLSSWLKDYVYIPLGGNRKGELRKYLNMSVVFLASGIWHGDGMKFLMWGGLHAIYQVFEGFTEDTRQEAEKAVGLTPKSFSWKAFRWVPTMLCVMIGWVVFRAPDIDTAREMVASMFTFDNSWILMTGELETLGLTYRDLFVLALSIAGLFAVEWAQITRGPVSEWLSDQHLVVRWTVCLAGIVLVWVFGTYGTAFDASSFIYGGF